MVMVRELEFYHKYYTWLKYLDTKTSQRYSFKREYMILVFYQTITCHNISNALFPVFIQQRNNFTFKQRKIEHKTISNVDGRQFFF